MLVQNAINALINSVEFKNLLKTKKIKEDGCHELTATIKKAVDYWYYEIYCNYNDPSNKNNDIIASVKVNEDGSGTVLNVKFL